MRKIDRLNDLLKAEPLPSYRARVADSGGGLEWLRKTYAKKEGVAVELTELLALPIQRLVKENT